MIGYILGGLFLVGLGWYGIQIRNLARRSIHRAFLEPLRSRDPRIQQTMEQGERWLQTKPSTSLTIPAHDGLLLHALYVPCPASPSKLVLFVPGFGMTHKQMLPYASLYPETSLLFLDARAHGESEGTFLTFGQEEAKDLHTWVTWSLQQLGSNCSIILHGVSLGAASILLAAKDGQFPSQVVQLVADAPFNDAEATLVHQAKQRLKLPTWLYLSTLRLVFRYFYHFDLRALSPAKALSSIPQPVFLLFGEKDSMVPAFMREAFQQTQNPLKDHLLFLPHTGHGKAILDDPQGYQRFLEGHDLTS